MPAPGRLRMLEPSDRELLRAFPDRVSSEAARARFHGALSTLTDRTLDALLDLEPGVREAVIAEDETGIAGVARYAQDEEHPHIAEVAIVVADDKQRCGLGRALMSELTDRARRGGIEMFRASVTKGNEAAIKLVAAMAPDAAPRSDGSELVFVWSLSL